MLLMTEKRFTYNFVSVDCPLFYEEGGVIDYDDVVDLLNALYEENKQLKAQLYCDDEEGICNICKHHYLVQDDETEFEYYNSRCKKGHYECARVSLTRCEDFEKELEE